MIKREDGKYCIYSHDGSRRLGCYATEPEAQKRLKQIEYFKHVKSGKIPMADVKNTPDCCKNLPCDKHAPVPATDKHKTLSEKRHKDTLAMVAKKFASKAKVTVKAPPGNEAKVAQQGIAVPSLKGVKDAEKIYATITAMTDEKYEAFASNLMKQLESQQERLTDAIKLAEKLSNKGITSEEFAKLADWTQSDILFQLMQ